MNCALLIDTVRLIVVTGPTASGKTALAVQLAKEHGCDVVSADSRQLYRQIPIVTAAPTAEEMQGVRHHFIGTHDITEYYSAAQYAEDVEALLPRLFERNDTVVMCGGSMLYIDAVLYGIDALPTISDEVRQSTKEYYAAEGLEGLRRLLVELDPIYLAQADRNNPRRLMHAIEICRQAGVPYSSLRQGRQRQLPYTVEKVMTDWPREQLYQRINQRVGEMVERGMVAEVSALYEQRHLNALNTVGCKEIFAYLDGRCTLEEALTSIARNTRVYAKKQLAWLRARHPDIRHIPPAERVTSLPH